MAKLTVKDIKLSGFLTENAKHGDIVKIIVKASITCDDPAFYVFVRQIDNLFLAKLNPALFPINSIFKFLIILHEDNTADIYVNDFQESVLARLNKDPQKGEMVYRNNITDIKELRFPGINIEPTDAIIYCSKVNWKFGLYFDLTHRIDPGTLFAELGQLRRKLDFDNIVDFTRSQILHSNKSAYIVTEGKTDWKHIEKAAQKLNIGLELDFDKYEETRGDKDILAMCKNFARKMQDKPLIFIFDRDNPAIIRKLAAKTAEGCDYQSWGNRVYSFLLPIPSHRKKYKHFSIEFFYQDEEIRTKDKEGKRLFFDNELTASVTAGKVINRTELGQPLESMEFEKKIEDKDVDRIRDETGKQIALSKSYFVQNILDGVEGFDSFDFTEFERIFSVIETIISTDK